MPRIGLLLPFLFVAGISAGGVLLLRQQQAGEIRFEQGFVEALMGESRRLFANHFFVKADAYFLRGYYPSIFEQAQRQTFMAEAEQRLSAGEAEVTHPLPSGPARHDWIQRFGQKFSPRLEGYGQAAEVREMLPWLEIAIELDPHQSEFYIVTAHLLRRHLGEANEAVRLLRRGWRHNPDNYEIIFHLGRVLYEEGIDVNRARNLFALALEKWEQHAREGGEPDWLGYREIVGQAGRMEEEQGQYAAAIHYYELLKSASRAREPIQQHIDRLRLLIEQ